MALVVTAERLGPGGELDLHAVLGDDWDRIGFVGPYATNEEARRILGLDFDIEAVSPWINSDGGSVVVLAMENRVVGWFLLPSEELGTCAEGSFPAQNAIFRIASDGPDFIDLVPNDRPCDW